MLLLGEKAQLKKWNQYDGVQLESLWSLSRVAAAATVQPERLRG